MADGDVRSRLMRAGAAILAVLQLALGPALAVTDAEAQGRSASPLAVHVEDHSQAECRAPHDERCVVCQQLQRVATCATPSALPGAAREGSHALRPPMLRAARVSARRLPPSRAPPIID